MDGNCESCPAQLKKCRTLYGMIEGIEELCI